MWTAHELAALAVILGVPLRFVIGGTLDLLDDIRSWLRTRNQNNGCNGEYNVGCPDCTEPTFADYVREVDPGYDETNVEPELEPLYISRVWAGPVVHPDEIPSLPTLARAKYPDELERDAYDHALTGWVARAKENNLPTYTTHSAAYAYLPEA